MTRAHMGTASGARLAFVDCETTGLDVDRHEIWEVGLILRSGMGTPDDPVLGDQEHHWFLPVDLSRADPFALGIGGFHDRHPQGYRTPPAGGVPGTLPPLTPLAAFAREFARLTDGAHLVGAVVSFDAERLDRLLRRQQFLPAWHYHLVDVEAMVAGRYALTPPWDSGELSDRAGVDRGLYEKHTALGDARWARALFDQMTSTSGKRRLHIDSVAPDDGSTLDERLDAADSGSGFAPDARPSGAGW